MTDNELTPHGDLLPPWQKHPELDRYSIGWRMGYGEGYMYIWDTWAQSVKPEQLIDYFKKYLPIPLEWLDWVANRCGYEIFSEPKTFAAIQWLEQQGLANFSEFMTWYRNTR